MMQTYSTVSMLSHEHERNGSVSLYERAEMCAHSSLYSCCPGRVQCK